MVLFWWNSHAYCTREAVDPPQPHLRPRMRTMRACFTPHLIFFIIMNILPPLLPRFVMP